MCNARWHPKRKEIFTIATPGGLHMPKRVPQGILNAKSFTSKRRLHACWVLAGLNCTVWVDDVIIGGLTRLT